MSVPSRAFTIRHPAGTVKVTTSFSLTVKLDGKEIAKHDLYSANVTPTPHRWGVHALEAGAHTLRFECVGKSPDSKGYLFGFGELMARIPVYSRDPSVDLRTLQKQ